MSSIGVAEVGVWVGDVDVMLCAAGASRHAQEVSRTSASPHELKDT